jgi:hypothetical protein
MTTDWLLQGCKGLHLRSPWIYRSGLDLEAAYNRLEVGSSEISVMV